jgi:KUP system potassium uptake protein
MTSNPGAPPSLIHYFKHAKTLHERILLLTVQTLHVPEVAEDARLTDLVDHGDGVHSAKIVYGFVETPDIPKVIARMKEHGVAVNPSDLSFFLGRESLVFTGKAPMSLPRKVFFKILSQNAVAASTFFRLPPGRVVELGIQVEI